MEIAQKGWVHIHVAVMLDGMGITVTYRSALTVSVSCLIITQSRKYILEKKPAEEGGYCLFNLPTKHFLCAGAVVRIRFHMGLISKNFKQFTINLHTETYLDTTYILIVIYVSLFSKQLRRVKFGTATQTWRFAHRLQKEGWLE